MKQPTTYNTALYLRLSRDDGLEQESSSIQTQKEMLTRYCHENGFTPYQLYIDDGWSGTNSDRPDFQRMLSDIEDGKINCVITKDLSRLGRNYLETGGYTEIFFPEHGVRYIAVTDSVDTANKDTSAMDMMPIVNLFNEWHSASTSKKIKSVFEASAKAGRYKTSFAAYGYTKADNSNHTPVIDPEAAEIVKRIFTLRSQGLSARHIADVLNSENIMIPSDYIYAKIGKPNPKFTRHLWCQSTIRSILNNQIYIGNLAQQKTTTISHKNHKSIKKEMSDWVIIENTHEPIIDKELWDKCQEVEASVSRGKRTKQGVTKPLSGLMYCVDCGYKMKLAGKNVIKNGEKIRRDFYNCASYAAFGKCGCTSHYILLKEIEAAVLADIRSMAKLAVENEQNARYQFMSKKEQINFRQTSEEQKIFQKNKLRLSELEKLIPSIYEDKVIGKISESVCIKLLEKYEAEQADLSEKIEKLEARINSAKQDENDVDEFIKRLKKYTDVQELTREMCLELIEYITVDEYTADRPRDIHIYYKLLDKPLADKKFLKSNENLENA